MAAQGCHPHGPVKTLNLKEGKKLTLPLKIVGGGELDGNHVIHGVEGKKSGRGLEEESKAMEDRGMLIQVGL